MTRESLSIPFGRPLLGEQAGQAVLEVLESGILTHGPRVKAFEEAFRAYTGAAYAVATGSCMAAMHLAYMHLGLKPDDEVIVPAQTHIATAHAAALWGARCVFVDSEPETGNIDIDAIEARITPRTRAISVVHYLGMPVDMGRVVSLARRHGLFVLEDCALAIGSRLDGTHAGLFGDVGCFSFYPVKHITTGEGGMLITQDPAIAESISRLRAFGIDRNIVQDREVPGMYDVVSLGLNYRLNEIGAAIGLEQMRRLPDFLARRHENHEVLAAGLRDVPGVRLLRSSHGRFESSHYCLAMILDRRLALHRPKIMAELKRRGVGTSVYYPRPVPLMSCYRNRYGGTAEEYPVAAEISSCSIALPVGPHIGRSEAEFMVIAVKETLAGIS